MSMKRIGKRSLSLLLVVMMLVSLFPNVALAAQITSGNGTWVSGKLTYTYVVESDGSSSNGAAGSVSVSGSTLTVKAVSSKATSGCDSTSAYATTTTVTVTNSSSYPLKINSITANGANVAGVNTGSSIASGSTFTISIIASPNSAEDTSSRTATGTVSISVTEERSATITALASPYVSYSLNGHAIAQGGDSVSFTADIGTTIQLPSITAPDGYTFKGWRVGSDPISTASSFVVRSSCSVYPVIISGDIVEDDYFKVGNQYYSYWEEAMGAAVSSSNKTVIVNKDATLPDSLEGNIMTAAGGNFVKPAAGGVEYIVPAGVTLLVPFDAAGTLYTTTPAVVYGSHDMPTAFRTLTVPDRAKITVRNGGAICVNSKLSSSGQMGGWNGTPTGPDGRIKMQGNSLISLESGAKLYCWGYIYGSGSVVANSGSSVYEAFQIKDWRGGTATSNVYKYAFIFNQFYVQNLEVPLTIYAGATEKLYSSVNASSSAYPISSTFIGTGGLFTINSGYIVKDYIESTDRLHVGVYGNVSMAPMTISGIPMIGSISTGDYILPITNNIGVDIHSGTTMVTQDMELLPGVEINIDPDAEMKIGSGKKVYVYDNDDWGNFSGTTRMYAIGYSVANGTTAVRTASGLTDAKIDVNGTLTVAGSLFTSNGGANITSSLGTQGDDGRIVFSTAPTASTTINEMEGNSTKTSVTFTAPKLLNGDESYSATVGTGTSSWYYDKDGEHWYRFKIDFVYNDKTVGTGYFCENGSTVTYDASWLSGLGASVSIGNASVSLSGTDVRVTNVSSDTIVTLSGTAAQFVPVFLLNEHQYQNYQNFTGNSLSETRTIDDETYYVVKKAEAAMEVGAEFAAPADTEMGISADRHNAIVWNLSGVSATSGKSYEGFVPVGETPNGDSYIFGFYTGAVAYNSATDAYYPTLAEAMEAVPAGGSTTVRLIADCGTYEEESGSAAFPIQESANVTIQLDGHHALGRLINSGTLTLDLQGGTWELRTGATAAVSAYRAVSAIGNTGDLTVQDTVGGGKITTDIASENGGSNFASVIRNDGGSVSVGAVVLEMTQMFNANNAVVMNYNGGSMSMTGTVLRSGYGYCVFNYGGTIGSISGVTMTGSYGINNRNMRGSNTLANGYNVSKIGTITTIDNCTIDVGQYAIYNGGIITTLSDSTLTTHPDSAQVDTLGNGSAARHGNVQGYTVFNSNAWWYDTNVWKRVDVTSGSFSRTDDYKEDQSCRPTIGAIDNCTIVAENTGTSADHGCALYNNGGVIGSISGGEIRTYKHPDNAKNIASNYALRNTAGGVINSISGVMISATGYSAVYNDGQFTLKTVNTYGDKIGGIQLHNTTTYGGASTIGSISDCAISAGSYYGIYTNGHIGSISGGSISANYNALLNSGAGSLSSYDYARSYGSNTDASTETKRVETYVRNMETGGVIGSISGVDFIGTGTNSYYLLQNQGYIGTLSNSSFSAATPRAGEGYAMLLNGDSRQRGHTLTREPYAYEDLFITPYEYHYDHEAATIDVIDGITVTKNATFAFRNLGQINTLKNSTFTGTQYVLVNAASGPYISRDSIRYYSGATKFATTKNSGSELTYYYEKLPAEIGVLDANTVNGTSTYALYNGGHLGTLTGNSVSSTNTTVLFNGGATVRSYDYNLKDIVSVAATASACTVTYGANDETRVITTDYDAPTIDLIGAGNHFSGTYQVLVNLGEIAAIDGGEDPVTITGTTQKQIGGIYTYTGTLDQRVATTPYTAGTAGTVANADTYLNAHIGSIKNTVITTNGIGIQNGSANANYLPTIDELGDGLEVNANCTTAGYHAVYNTTYAKIGEITGGVYTAKTATTNAFRNNNTNAEQATLISAGDFKGMAATRVNAIFEPDNTARQTYPEGYSLSMGPENVTLHDGSSAEGYFFIATQVQVLFETNGGSEVQAQTLMQGSKLTRPEDPTKEGFRFAGWFSDEQLTEEFDFDTPVMEAMTLYAKWENANSFAVKFFDADGETQIGETQTVAAGERPIAPENEPTKAPTDEHVYEFAGWKLRGSEDSSATKELPAITADTDFIAVFTEKAREYEEPVWSWTDLNAATASFSAKDDPSFVKTLQATITTEELVAATCSEEGQRKITATVSFLGETYSDSKTEQIPSTGHEWDVPTYEWAEDNSTVTATRVCKHDATHIETETVNTTSEVTKAATCEAKGETTYTATFANTAFETQTKVVENLDALGHDWNEPTYEWAEDNSSVTASRVCKNDATHIETETVNTTSAVTKAATCEAKGETTYTATFTNPAFETQTKVVENIDALGHDWDAPVWTWAEDSSSAIASFSCKRDPSHMRSIQASVTTGEGAGEHLGYIVFTATLTGPDGETYSDVRYVIHVYTVIWRNWNGDELEKDEAVPYGSTPVYDGAQPEKQEDVANTYRFIGWDPEPALVTNDAIYTAQFEAAPRSYTIRFLDEDGSVISSAVYRYGTAADEIVLPAPPEKAPDAQYSYSFNGWTPSVADVQGDADYTASYSRTLRSYTIRWLAWDGTELEKDENVPYGTTPVYDGETPSRPEDARYRYSFIGWDPAVADVSGDADYTAQFAQAEKSYTVRFEPNAPDGIQIVGEMATQTVQSVTETALNANSFRPEPATDECVFDSWNTEPDGSGLRYEDEEPVALLEDTVLYAQWTVKEHNITWRDADGSVLLEQLLPYGSLPLYTGPTPYRAPDAQYFYSFTGWDPQPSPVTGDATYTATYSSTTRTYTILWLDEDGTILEQDDDVPYGTVPSYDGETPVKEGDAQFVYSFAGWEPTVSAVTGDASYTATYTEDTARYTVTWNNDDGNALEVDTDVPYGSMPSYDGETPSKAETVQYRYVFAGWSPEVGTVTGNVTYTATFTAIIKQYSVCFVDEDGTVLLEERLYDYGTQASEIVKPEEPVKPNTAEFSYSFVGWDPAIAEVTEDVTYTATYSAQRNRYTITWLDDDGTLLSTTETEYGQIPAYVGDLPVKGETAQYRYSLAGWEYVLTDLNGEPVLDEEGETQIVRCRLDDPEAQLPAVTGPASYTAFYDRELRSYTITWLMDDGSLIGETSVLYGETPSHEDPVKPDTAEFSYSFTDWDPALAPVTGETSYRAIFRAARNSYPITWLDEDGTVLDVTTVEYGQIPSHAVPQKAPDAQYGYLFSCWTPDLVSVTGPATYRAIYERQLRSYTVLWLDEDGTVLEKDENVPYGATPQYDGEIPTKPDDSLYSYRFDRWEPAITTVTGDVSYRAVYVESLRRFTLTFNAGEGTVDPAAKEVTAGETVGELPVPTREGGWVFIGWFTEAADSAFTAGQGTQVTAETVLEGDTTVYAHWRLPGDINGDGKVNNKDWNLLMKYVKYHEGTVVEINLDVTGDGKVNNKDWNLLLKYVKYGGVEIH